MTTIDVLRAVHHPIRRRIIEYLYIYGDSQVGKLAKALELQVGSISHHLRMLERAGVVERAPELAVDGRTSWWRTSGISISWDVDDYADKPAEMMQARAAERLNFEHQIRRFSEWRKKSAGYSRPWRRSAFSADGLAYATPDELSELSSLVAETVSSWREAIDRDDGQEREPVYWFVHGFPVRP
jgi:DNA-binding transcriptional ArsR family regulator